MLLKVSTKSNPRSVAGILADLIRTEGKAEITVIGAGALNTAIKSIIIAKSFLIVNGIDIAFIPAFSEGIIEGNKTTMIKLTITQYSRIW